MNLVFELSGKLNLLNNTIHFFKKHFIVITGLGCIAAFGRVIQLGGFGEITSWLNLVLEVVVESVRVLLFLYVLGLASIKDGFLRMRRLFTHKNNRNALLTIAIHKLKKQWLAVLLNTIGFLLIAWVINYLIDLLAYKTCLYLALKKEGILAASSSEWAILLFFKNLSVIPFTLIFETVFLLWVTNKPKNSGKISIE